MREGVAWLLPKPGSLAGQGGLRWPGVLVSGPPRTTSTKPLQTRVLGGWEPRTQAQGAWPSRLPGKSGVEVFSFRLEPRLPGRAPRERHGKRTIEAQTGTRDRFALARGGGRAGRPVEAASAGAGPPSFPAFLTFASVSFSAHLVVMVVGGM